MKYSNLISGRMPYASFMLDQGTSTILDYSGNGHTASQKSFADAALTLANMTGNLAPAVAYASQGWRANQGRYTEFNVPFLDPGSENNDFSVETWVRISDGVVADADIPMSIFAKTPSSHGIWFDRKNIYFGLSFSGGVASSVISAPRFENKRVHIVATKTGNKINLYLDGYLQATTTLTSEQESATYISGGFPKMGKTTSSTFAGSVIGNAFSVFKRALSDNEIRENHLIGLKGSDAYSTSLGGRATVLEVRADSTFDTFTIESLSDWQSGEMYGVNFGDGFVEPEPTAYVDNEQPVWIGTIPLSSLPASSQGYFFVADSDVRIVYSTTGRDNLNLNGTSYGSRERFWNPTAAQQETAGNLVFGLIWPQTSQNVKTSKVKIMGVKLVSNPDAGGRDVVGVVTKIGLPRHPMELSSFAPFTYDAAGFTLTTAAMSVSELPSQPTPDEILATLIDPVTPDPNDGSVPPNSGGISVPEKTLTPPSTNEDTTPVPSTDTFSTELSPIRTIEIWGFVSGTVQVLSGATVLSTTNYSQGTTAAPHRIENELVHIVLPSTVTDSITIKGINPQAITVYPTALTAQQIASVAESYFGIKSTKIDEMNEIAVQVPNNPVENYSFAWSTTTAS